METLYKLHEANLKSHFRNHLHSGASIFFIKACEISRERRCVQGCRVPGGSNAAVKARARVTSFRHCLIVIRRNNPVCAEL